MIDYFQVHDRNEIVDIGRIHKLIFPDYFLSLLNDKLVTDLYDLYWEESNMLFVAKENGAIVGFLLGIRKDSISGKQFVKKHFFSLLIRMAFLCMTLNRIALRKIKTMVLPRKNNYEPIFAGNHDAFILSIGVLPLYQGKGIAKELFRRFEELLSELNIQDYGLAMKRNNDSARCFYEKMGMNLEHLTEEMEYYQKELQRYL